MNHSVLLGDFVEECICLEKNNEKSEKNNFFFRLNDKRLKETE